jgi:hypothetical protein
LEEQTSKHLERAWSAQIKNVLTLRADQKEAVEKCLAGNHIINMPTGSGKTLISVKIVDHFLQMRPKQNVVFVVPTCALVRQQAKYLRSLLSMYMCPHTVAAYASSLLHMCPHTHEARGLRTHSDVAGCTVAELSGQEMDSWDARYSVFLLYWYTSTDTDAAAGSTSGGGRIARGIIGCCWAHLRSSALVSSTTRTSESRTSRSVCLTSATTPPATRRWRACCATRSTAQVLLALQVQKTRLLVQKYKYCRHANGNSPDGVHAARRAQQRRCSLYLLCYYKSTNTDTTLAAVPRQHVSSKVSFLSNIYIYRYS